MIKNEIDQLLAKYWECETTLDEEQLLKQYFVKGDVDASHLPFKAMFEHLNNEQALGKNFDVASLITTQQPAIKRNTIDSLLEEYWAGESSVADEDELKLYFGSGAVAKRHKDYKCYFNYLSREESKSSVNLDVKAILKKDGLVKKEAIIRPIGRRLRNVAAIAAVLIAAGVAFFATDVLKSNEAKYAGKVTVLEQASEQEEAMEITKEALALLSNTFGRGQASIANEIKQIDKLNILIN